MTTSLHTARKHRLCDMAYPGAHPILPGELYLRHVTFPGEEGHEYGTKPVVHAECGWCVNQRGDWIHARYGVTVRLGDQVEYGTTPATVIDFTGGHLLLRLANGCHVATHPRYDITYREAS